MNSNENLITINNLFVDYKFHFWEEKKTLLKGITFEIKSGKTTGLIGRNGAGKTTIIKSIIKLIKPKSGEIVYNLNPVDFRYDLGYLPELPYFYDHLTVKETLVFFAKLFKWENAKVKTSVNDVIERLQLQPFINSRIKKISKGQQQRLGIAQAIINKPKLLILDEPFSGLDPLSRIEIRNLFQELKNAGTTILIASHVLSDLEHLCDRVVIIDKGNIKGVKEMTEINKGSYEILIPKDTPEELIKNYTAVIEQDIIRLSFTDINSANTSLQDLLKNGVQIIKYTPLEQPLEKLFIELNS